ncbi:MAG: hypothetical protein EBX52_05600, partial [Proteobacteria bacterium]|nr:hypothetical protein [Pseudomonadota bacterium]
MIARANASNLIVVPSIKLLTHQEKFIANSSLQPQIVPSPSASPVFYKEAIGDRVDVNPFALLSVGQGKIKTVYQAIYAPTITEIRDLFETEKNPFIALIVGMDEQAALVDIDTARRVAPGKTMIDTIESIDQTLSGSSTKLIIAADSLVSMAALSQPPYSMSSEALYTYGGINGDEYADQSANVLSWLKTQRKNNKMSRVALFDWHYDFKGSEYKSLDYLKKETGGKVPLLGATWQREVTIAKFTKYALDRSRKLPMLGMMATSWYPVSVPWYEGNIDRLINFSGKAFFARGQNLSPEDHPDPAHLIHLSASVGALIDNQLRRDSALPISSTSVTGNSKIGTSQMLGAVDENAGQLYALVRLSPGSTISQIKLTHPSPGPSVTPTLVVRADQGGINKLSPLSPTFTPDSTQGFTHFMKYSLPKGSILGSGQYEVQVITERSITSPTSKHVLSEVATLNGALAVTGVGATQRVIKTYEPSMFTRVSSPTVTKEVPDYPYCFEFVDPTNANNKTTKYNMLLQLESGVPGTAAQGCINPKIQILYRQEHKADSSSLQSLVSDNFTSGLQVCKDNSNNNCETISGNQAPKAWNPNNALIRSGSSVYQYTFAAPTDPARLRFYRNEKVVSRPSPAPAAP